MLDSSKTYILAQLALRAPPEVALQCVAGHCYYWPLLLPGLVSIGTGILGENTVLSGEVSLENTVLSGEGSLQIPCFLEK